jgi:hypothetical protein
MALLLGTLCPADAASNDAQWKSPRFHTTANNTRLATVLQRFAKAQGVRLNIVPGVDGRVTGKFDMPPEKMLDTLASLYNFSWRLDGRNLTIAPMTFATTLAQPLSNGVALKNSNTMQLAAGSAPPAPSDPALSPLKVWSTTPADKTLQNALARWSIAAGWQMFWELPQDYSVEATASINGSFEDAITAVTTSLQQNDVPVSAIFFEGNRVLRIVAKGAQ